MESGLSNIHFQDADRLYYIHLLHEEEHEYFYCQKIPFAGFICKIFHCLKMPHSGSKLVLNFPVPLAIEKITPRKWWEHSEVLLKFRMAQWDPRILTSLCQLFPIFLKVESGGIFCLHLSSFSCVFLLLSLICWTVYPLFRLNWHIFSVLIQYPGVLNISGGFLFNPERLQIRASMCLCKGFVDRYLHL